MTNMEERREEAIKRLKAKSDFRAHLLVYVLVNALLIGIWAVSGAGFFWPIFSILGWGIGLAFHAYGVYGSKTISEEDIEAEMRRIDPTGTPL